ncbi:3-oxoacyl-[acyl-carrier-protein] reductase [Mycoplasmatota bacterium]|nr:3-oxoacyl-[acyl-carrier-protein] reductase [Mycoplasmatota bacterium]
MDLTNKIAIVTGGATGIGREISLKLASYGATVVVNYNSSSNASESLVEEIKQMGKEAYAIKANISNYDEAQMLINSTIEKYGKVDILVNNAGITADSLLLRMKENDFDKVIDVNLKGTWNCCKHIAKHMSKQRSGKIINISSVVGIMGNIGQTNYCASKAGIIGLTKSLARELAKRNICCNAVAPGFIETKMTESLSEEIRKEYTRNIPLDRLGKASDVANLVAFLSSHLSDYITGQVINCDGGLVMY